MNQPDEVTNSDSDGRWFGYPAVLVSVVAVVALRLAISVRGYLYADDFAFRYWADTQPLGWNYLMQSYGGHVNPVGLFNQWVLQAVYPGSHLALALFTLVLWTMTLYVAALAVIEMTGRQSAGVLIVLFAGLSLFGFENTVWWAAAIYGGPYQLFLVSGLYAIVRALRRGSPVWVWIAVACSAAAAFSFTRGFMAGFLMFLVAATIPIRDSKRLGIRGALMWQPVAWAVMALSGAVALGLAIIGSDRLMRSALDVVVVADYVWKLLVLNVLPALWGGPWRWFEIAPQEWSPIVTNPAPPWWAVWLFALASLLAAIAIVRKRPDLRAQLGGVLAFCALVLLAAAIARSGTAVASVAYRYTFDVVWPFGLLIVTLSVPMWWQSKRPVKRVTWILTAVFVASALISTVVPARDWAANQGKQYMANAVSGFDRIPSGTMILNQGVPFDLIHPALMAPYANAEVVMTPQPGSPDFGAFAEMEMFGFAPDGNVRRQDVVGPMSKPGPDPDCGYRVTDSPRSIKLEGELIEWVFYARIAYYTGTETALNVAFGGQINTVPLRAEGVRAVYFPVSGPGDEILVSVGTPGVVACITDVRIGNRVDAETQEPVPWPVTRLAP